jgi:hypothetical protein
MLVKVASRLPQGEAVMTFLQNIEELKKVTKLNLGIYTRAEALALAAT